MTDPEREAFEAWAKSDGRFDISISDGAIAWYVWQAARAPLLKDAARFVWLVDHILLLTCADDDTEAGNFRYNGGNLKWLFRRIDAAMEKTK